MKNAKKIIMSIVLILLVVVLSGCTRNQTLTCEMNKNQSGINMNTKVETIFKNDHVVKLNLYIDAKLDESLSSYATTFESVLKNEYEKYKKEGTVVDVSTSGNTVKANLSFDLNKMSEKDKKELDIINTKGTKNATKTEFEKEGYTCK